MEFRKKAEIMDEAAMTRAIKRIAHEIIERNKGTENLMLIGIQRRGVPLAKRIGELIAQRALAKQITDVVFDRGGYLYHGRIQALADGAREAGLKF